MPDSRKYQETHPHITFQLNLAAMPPRFWMLMGEARSKCDHISRVPLEPETSEKLHEVYFAKGIHATTAIEDNTLSEEEVRERMAGDLELPPSKEYLGREVDNMLAAYNEVMGAALFGEPLPLSIDSLKHLNKRVLDGLSVDDRTVPGEIRTHSVMVGSYRGAPAEDCAYLLERLCEWVNGIEPAHDNERIPMAFIKATLAHIYFEWIHPFGDGNGRVGRLIEFAILTNHGIPAPAAHVLTSHYNDTRSQYYRELQAASSSGGDVTPFLLYAAQGFVDGLLVQIKELHKQQEALMWRAYVDRTYEGQARETASRRRKLALELGKLDGEWVRREDIPLLDRRLMKEYGSRADKTLTRDLNLLAKEGYVVLHGTRWVRAKVEVIKGMRPQSAPAGPADDA